MCRDCEEKQKLGYMDFSPYKNNPYIDIFSDTITMNNVSKPIIAKSDTGETKILPPNSGTHYFKDAKVVREIPLAQDGLIQNDIPNKKEDRNRIYNSVEPYNYPYKEIFPAMVRYLKGSERTYYTNPTPQYKTSVPSVADEDAWAFFLGVPQRNNTIVESKYTPTQSKKTDRTYYTLSGGYPNFKEMVIKDAEKAFNTPRKKTDFLSLPSYISKKLQEAEIGKLSKEGDKATGVISSFFPLENVTYGKGKDIRGNYYSLYDIYDFNLDYFNRMGKPYEIYDRVYYKENKGEKIPVYFNDNELYNIDLNKNNADVSSLQKELLNRGYKISKAFNVYGEPTGIADEDTKKSLSDWKDKYKNAIQGFSYPSIDKLFNVAEINKYTPPKKQEGGLIVKKWGNTQKLTINK